MSDPVRLEVGELDVDRLALVFQHVPADVTYADEDGVIRYYSGRYRIFSRDPGNIGTDVLECHSPASREPVRALLARLAAGERDEEDFLDADKDGRPVVIRYVAVRDADGGYRGVLEHCTYADVEG